MILHTQSKHDWSVTPELAVLLCGPRGSDAGFLKGLFSFRKNVPEGRLERHWYRRPD